MVLCLQAVSLEEWEEHQRITSIQEETVRAQSAGQLRAAGVLHTLNIILL